MQACEQQPGMELSGGKRLPSLSPGEPDWFVGEMVCSDLLFSMNRSDHQHFECYISLRPALVASRVFGTDPYALLVLWGKK